MSAPASRNRTVALIVALLAVTAGVWFFFLRGRDKDVAATSQGDPAARSGAIAAGSGLGGKHEQADSTSAPKGMAPRWQLDLDREGPLTLEGQVVGPDGKGVGGATVYLSSVPTRTVTSEADGSFAFAKLVGRSYEVTAATGDLFGGPVTVKVVEKGDPVVVRVAPGATLAVTVMDEQKQPIAGAEVRPTEDRVFTTDDKGKALVRPLGAGWVNVDVHKDGYAPNSGFTTVHVGETAPAELAITLHKGQPVSGRVVDDGGHPIAKAKVAVAGMFGFGGDKRGVETDDKGQFAFAAIAPGRHQLDATDGEHAPAASAPITVADKPIENVEIVMKAGGSISGVVLGADQNPVPYAIVRAQTGQAAGGRRGGWGGSYRQVSADKSGAFELRGLPRNAVQVRAESDSAASKVQSVDLDKDKDKKDVRLVLDVAGLISGVVVDEKGAPVPEVQVHAFADMWGSGGSEDVALAGMSTATTDGAGAFAIRGLPDGEYKLWAARGVNASRDWGQTGVTAKVGDKDVKITLASPGSLKGVVKIDGQSTAPKLALVQVGFQPGQPTGADGGFSIGELAPGQYEVTFRSPEFAELIKHDVKIEAGKTTDLGTVTVMRGRKLVGKVVDGGGAPVAGAKVRVAFMLFSLDGADEQMDAIEKQSGVRTAITDTDGGFSIIGISPQGTNAAAEHPDLGRSTAISIPEGKDDPEPITLVLHGFGSITGKVVLKGAPQSGVMVSVNTKGGGAQAVIAQTAEDGSFSFAKVPEGPTVLSAMRPSSTAFKSASTTVTVVAKQTTTATIDIPVGTITLQVTPKAMAGAQVDSAQVFLFNGAVVASSAKQLMDSFMGGAVQSMKFWMGPSTGPAVFDEIVPGGYTVCIIPITGNLKDPSFGQKIQQHLDVLKVVCKQVTITPSPTTQQFTQEVPSMPPLPKD